MQKWIVAAAFIGICTAADLSIGQPAPPLTLKKLLQAPEPNSVTWASLRGNVVVLEFWATWCTSCRDQIPHLNSLVEQFRDKPVRFLSLTDEDPEIVVRFLKEHSISGWIGLDSNEQSFKRYGIEGRPTTVLVDAAGIVRGIGNTSDVNQEMLHSLLANRPITFSFSSGLASTSNRQSLPEPFYQIMVRPAGAAAVTGYSPGAVKREPERIWATWGVGLKRLLSDAYSIPEARVESPGWGAIERYDVAVAAPHLTEPRRAALLRQALEQVFQLKYHMDSRETNVYVLRCIPGMKPKLESASSQKPTLWNESGSITAISAPITSIAILVGRLLNSTVVEETGLTGRYDFNLKWDTARPQSVRDALRTQLGLDLSPSKRALDYLVVDSATQPKSW